MGEKLFGAAKSFGRMSSSPMPAWTMTATKIAKALKDRGIQVPVIVMASQHEGYDDSRAGGSVADHIVKPFDSQGLIDKVTALASEADRASAASPLESSAFAPEAHSSPRPEDQAPRRRQGLDRTLLGQPPAQQTPPKSPAPPPPPSSPSVPAFQPISIAPTSDTRVSELAGLSKGAPAPGGTLARKLAEMELAPEQIDGVLALTREVVEQVVWEVVPDLAETLIREEIQRLTAE